MSEQEQVDKKKFIDWIKEIPGGKLTGIGLFLVLMGVCIYFIHDFHWETEGEIIVDEPKVYTRERLVNDRFREEAWLNEQLTEPKRKDFLLPEARMSSIDTQQLALTAKTTQSDHSETEQDQTATSPKQSEAAGQEKVLQDIATSPVDTFIDMLDYRDKVRNELMRIQLDDRHDIEGNTLYRLNFDTAIIPGDHTHSSAAILVTITPDDEANNATENKKALFKEWTGEMQTLVDSLIHDKVESFNNEILDKSDPFLSDEQAKFEGFLRGKIYDKVKSLSEKLYKKQNNSNQEIIYPESRKQGENQLNTSAAIVYDCPDHKDDPFFCEVEKLIGSYSINFDQAKNNKKAEIFYKELIKRTHFTGEKIRELSKKIATVGCPPPTSSEPSQVLYKVNDGVFEVKLEDKNAKKSADDFLSWQHAPCFQSSPPTHRLLVIMSLLDRLSAVSSISIDKILNLIKFDDDPNKTDAANSNKIESYPKVIEELTRPYVCGKHDENNPFFYQSQYKHIKQPYYYENVIKNTNQRCQPSLDYPDEGYQHLPNKNKIAELMVTYQAEKLTELDGYFTAKVEGCDMQQCRLVLSGIEGTDKKLMEKLSKVTQTFSYAVTPQMQAQRIALLNKQKEQLNILVNAAIQGGNGNAEGLIQKLSTLEKELKILERYPLVVGFGDWQYEKKANANYVATQRIELLNNQKESLINQVNTASRVDNNNLKTLKQQNNLKTLKQQLSKLEEELEILESESNINTRFGWVIRPQLTGNPNSFDSPEFRHFLSHYSLSAVISIPSWWRSIKVHVNKCWVTNPKLSADFSSLCDNNDGLSPSFTIKVPGSARDINQKLRFEVVKAPYLLPKNYEPNRVQKIEVGRKGAVLLEGGRLWRSTVVMLDNQKADNIEVLPDMKAVMAIFQCVKPSAGDPMSAYKEDAKGKNQVNLTILTANDANVPSLIYLDSLSTLLLQQKPANALSKDSLSSSNPGQNSDIPVGQVGEGFQKSNNEKYASIQLWTSEGNTSSNPLRVILKPFVPRYPKDKPCYEIEANEQASQKN